MAESEESKHLRLKVANFGPIAEADIDLRPMTVFVGPSNTGKSYLAMLIYALHRFFSGAVMDPSFHESRDFSIYSSLGYWTRDMEMSMSEGEINAVSEWVKQGNPGGPVPPVVAALVRRGLCDVSAFGDRLNSELARCFGIEDTEDLIRYRSGFNSNINMEIPISDHSEPFGYNFILDPDEVEFNASFPDTILLPDTIPIHAQSFDLLTIARNLLPGWRVLDDDQARKEFAFGAMNRLYGPIGAHIVRSLNIPAHYLPADRTGVMHTHRVVVRSLIARAPRAGSAQASAGSAFSGVTADFLEQLVILGDSHAMLSSNDSTLPYRLEKEILHGGIIGRSSATDYPDFYYRPEGWKREIPLMNSSSMVSELAPVVLYLRHVVEPGDVLIIEEPESHLHPAMQVEFVRHLAAAVNAGIRIMLTTHSEWVLEELANLIRLSELPKSRRKDFVDTNSALTEDQLGVWLFETKKSPKGTVVREIPLDLEIGNFPSGYDVVATETYNRWAEISNLIGTRR